MLVLIHVADIHGRDSDMDYTRIHAIAGVICHERVNPNPKHEAYLNGDWGVNATSPRVASVQSKSTSVILSCTLWPLRQPHPARTKCLLSSVLIWPFAPWRSQLYTQLYNQMLVPERLVAKLFEGRGLLHSSIGDIDLASPSSTSSSVRPYCLFCP